MFLSTVRDTNILRTMDLAVFALGSVPARGPKTGVGEVGVTLALCCARIQLGDFIALEP